RTLQPLRGLACAPSRWQRQHHAVELAAYKFFKQHLGLCFAQLQPQWRISRLQSRQHARQYVWSECRDDAEFELTAEHIAVARKIDEIAGGGENTFGALRHLQAGVGE